MALEDLLQRIDPSKYIYALSERKDLNWDIIQKYPALPWPADALSRLAPLAYITQNPDETWNYFVISRRKDLTIDFMRQYKDKLDWAYISMNIDFQDVIENPELPWIGGILILNKKIKPNDIIENSQCEWDYTFLSWHIDLDFVYANPQCEWNYIVLSERVCLDFINQNPQCEWDYDYLSRNPNITIDFILEHLDKRWNWDEIYKNPNITLEDLIINNLHSKQYISFQKRYPDYCLENLQDLDWKIISKYASLDIIKKYPNKMWDYFNLSINNNITIDFILEHPALPWDYISLSYNPGITLEDVLNNWELPWDVNGIVAYKY